MEQHSKKFNIIINGLPKTENKNTREKFKIQAGKLDTEIHNNDISAIHRLLARKRKTQAIIVRLNDLHLKATLIRKSKNIKLRNTEINENVFADEHLVSRNVNLLGCSKELVASGTLRFVMVQERKSVDKGKGRWTDDICDTIGKFI